MFEIVYESIWRWKLARRRAGGEKHEVRKLSFRGVFHFRAKKKEKRENDEPPGFRVVICHWLRLDVNSYKFALYLE